VSARVVILSLLLVACGGGAGGPTASTSAGSSGSSSQGEAARVRAFEQGEDEILRDLATLDRRIAQRARLAPRESDLQRVAMGALFADEPSLAMIEGAIDPFSFDARARGLAGVRKKIEALPADLPGKAQGMTPTPAFERELLTRLVDEESLRLEEERVLPRSASALFRGIVETWPPTRATTTPETIAERDRWLSRRLGEVRAALGQGTLDATRARELDDTLDALEHLVDAPGFQKSTAELVRVRESLEAQGSGPPERAHSEWEDVARRIRAHLGTKPDPEQLDRDLDAAQKDLARRAKAVNARLSSVVFASGECVDAVPGSRLRSMAPPPERVPACHLRHFVALAQDEVARAIALAAMHDHVVVARWALDVARGRGTLAQATGRNTLLATPNPDQQARLERIAQARPVLAIGAGEAVRILLASSDPMKQARAWNELGDVPLDVAAEALRAAASSDH
jgi:hypothetical protein